MAINVIVTNYESRQIVDFLHQQTDKIDKLLC